MVLDLSEVSLVDVEVVRFLSLCEMQGIRLAHCPAYIREWMVRGEGSGWRSEGGGGPDRQMW